MNPDELCRLYGIESLPCNKDTPTQRLDDDSIGSPSLCDRVNSKLFIVRETDAGEVIWRRPIEDADAIAIHLVANDSLRYRLPCHSFRSMLVPMKKDEMPPIKKSSWLLCCLRGLFWYSQGEASKKTWRFHFPEMAYCWFTDHNDDDKWAFLQGLTFLAKVDAEGWIVYQLLNDEQGEHLTSFLFHVMSILKKHMGSSWEHQIGLYLQSDVVASKSSLEETIKALGRSLDDPPSSMCEASYWLSVDSAHVAINDIFYGDYIKSAATSQELHQKLQDLVVDLRSKPSVDLFAFVQMITKAYLVHMQKQFTLIKLMFETSSNGTLTDFYDEPRTQSPSTNCDCDVESVVSLSELFRILKTLWPQISENEIAIIYREAYDLLFPPMHWRMPSPNGITFESFMAAADRLCLFSRMRASLEVYSK